MSLRYAPSKRYAKYVKAAMACGHWRDGAKVTGNDKALLVHIRTGKTVAYGLHDGGSDWNGARNFAKEAGDICGCLFVQPRGRKRSRKADQRTDFDPSRARRENERWRESWGGDVEALRSEEHTSELQSRENLVCRL